MGRESSPDAQPDLEKLGQFLCENLVVIAGSDSVEIFKEITNFISSDETTDALFRKLDGSMTGKQGGPRGTRRKSRFMCQGPFWCNYPQTNSALKSS